MKGKGNGSGGSEKIPCIVCNGFHQGPHFPKHSLGNVKVKITEEGREELERLKRDGD